MSGQKIRRPALRYFGGKWMLAPWIISLLPPHEIYVEPFGGAASVLMRKPRAKVEVYNDLDGEIVNVFRVLRDKDDARRLERNLRFTPYARGEYALAFLEGGDDIERARRTIVRAFMGHGPDSVNPGHRSGFRAKTLNSNRTAALDWVNYPPEVPRFCERLSGVTIEARDAFELIPDFDTEHTLFYVDPPYLHATRGDRHNYRHELSDDVHARLLNLLSGLRGMVVLSGYASPEYERLGWKRCETEAMADGARARVECAWLNPAAQARQRQMEFVEAGETL